jgi:dienelactone hydrolase
MFECYQLPRAVSSPAKKMKMETVEYKDRDVRLPGYLAYDDKVSGKRPGVIVMPQVCGPGVHSRTKADRLVALGYVAFASDYYGNGRELTTCPTRYSLRIRCSTTPARCAGAGWRRSTSWLLLPLVDSSRLASIGFCMGGNFSLELAREGAPLRGVVSFHGGLHTERPAQKGQVKARILVCTGEDHQLVPAEQVNALQAEMTAAGVDWQVITYGGVRHNFTDPDAARSTIPHLSITSWPMNVRGMRWPGSSRRYSRDNPRTIDRDRPQRLV